MNADPPSSLPAAPSAAALAARLEKWRQLRDELAALSAQLETMSLLLRLQRQR
jgi:hypothetical protein